MTKIGILASHPVQYHSPIYRYLARKAPGQIHVFFGSRTGARPSLDKGFGRVVQWDIPLLNGYDFTFLHTSGRDPGPGLHYFNGFWKEFRRNGCDTLIIWNTYASRAFMRYLLEARHANVPVIYRGDTYQSPDGSSLRDLAKTIYLKSAFRMVDHFLAIGSWSRQFYLHLGIPSHRITLAPYAIDNDYFFESSAKARLQRQSVREKLGISPEAMVFNLTGKYHRPKRPLDLVNAAALCTDIPIHLLLVGEGELRRILESEIHRLNLRNVTMTGFVNQSKLPTYYVASDVAVISSTHNPWITVVNEAMCCGLPLLL